MIAWMNAVALVAAVTGVTAAPLSAHPRLVSASPGPGATVKAPTSIALKFSERLVGRFSGIAVSPAAGATSRAPGVLTTSVAPDGRTLVAHLRTPLAAGSYNLAWHAVSVDTHRVAGSYRFTAR